MQSHFFFLLIAKQVCRQMNLPSTKLGKDATFFVGWKKKTRQSRFTVNYIVSDKD